MLQVQIQVILGFFLVFPCIWAYIFVIILLKKIYLYFICIYMCVWVHAPMCGVCVHAYVYKCHVFIDVLKGQKRV